MNMSKEELRKQSEAITDAEQKITQYQEALEAAKRESAEAYESLVQARALHSAGEGSDTAVSQATKRYEKAQQAINEAELNVDVAKETAEVQRQKLADLRRAYKSNAEQRISSQLPAIITEIQQTYDAFIKANEKLEQLRTAAKDSGLTANEANELIPQSFTNLMQPKPGRKLSSYELSAFISFDNWIKQNSSITKTQKPA